MVCYCHLYCICSIYGSLLHILYSELSYVLCVSLIFWLTLHLDQELCLDAAGSLALVLVPGATQRVHLVDEDD